MEFTRQYISIASVRTVVQTVLLAGTMLCNHAVVTSIYSSVYQYCLSADCRPDGTVGRYDAL